jgi:hypothetical protein
MPNKLTVHRVNRKHTIVTVIKNQNTLLSDPALKYAAANLPIVLVYPSLATSLSLKRHYPPAIIP